MPEVLTPDDSIEKLGGLDLDLAVAHACDFACPSGGQHEWRRSLATGCAKCMRMLPLYSQSIEAAMEVVEKIGFEANDSMKAINISVFSIHRYPDGQWLVHFSLKGKAYADTLPRAICLAALKAVGAE